MSKLRAIRSNYPEGKDLPRFLGDHPSILRFAGLWDAQSWCQITGAWIDDRLVLTLISVHDAPTGAWNIYEAVATHLRRRDYPSINPAVIEWLHCFPATEEALAFGFKHSFARVRMKVVSDIYEDNSFEAIPDEEVHPVTYQAADAAIHAYWKTAQ